MSVAGKFTAVFGIFGVGAVMLFMVLPCSSNADDGSATIGDVSVDNVEASPARAGETTRVTFTVENAGAQAVTITGILLTPPEPSRVMGFLGHTGHTSEIGAIRVGPGEAVQLDGRKAWIEIGPLTRDLMPGSIVAARLLIGAYDAAMSIHVSPAPEPPVDRKADITRGVTFDKSGLHGWLRTLVC